MFEKLYLVSSEDVAKLNSKEADAETKSKVLDYETIYDAVVKCQEEKAAEEETESKKKLTVNKWLKFKLN
jgi:hypothetical protein